MIVYNKIDIEFFLDLESIQPATPASRSGHGPPKVNELKQKSNFSGKKLNIYELAAQDIGSSENSIGTNGMR